jgi:hypothetical protein
MSDTRQKIQIITEEKNKKMNWKKFISRYRLYFLIALLILLVALGVFFALKHFKKSVAQLPQLPQLMIQEAKEDNLMEGKSAIALGLAAARAWRSDAELSYVLSADAGQLTGRSNNWQLIYVSPSVKGKGYLVKITDAKISDTAEISYAGSAAEFPADVISQADAVAQVKAIPGFANVKILHVGMIYDAAAKSWFWGVETAKATVTVKAEK